eukprot:TRINITY_DN20163_c0_g1_i3.p1 TRINITY_DN20163_c0_g1~~TRINITY_DN20163_c0_g1_i3.p1  ORF type:complete len:720 (-),score=146.23 TRINITY_DN20163_c0_g1_i3:1224-3383(-)
MDAPLVGFLLSIFCCSLAVLLPAWLFRRAFLSPLGYMQPAGFYLRWLESPLYNVQARRLDPENYKAHVKHFLENEICEDCVYCSHLTGKQPERDTKLDQLFRHSRQENGQEWFCLTGLVQAAQSGAISSAELRCAVQRMQYGFCQGGQLREALRDATAFAQCLEQAELLTRCLQIDTEKRIELDGIFEGATEEALCKFLVEEHVLQDPYPDGLWESAEVQKALQKYLKKQGYYDSAVQADGCFKKFSIRALQSLLLDAGAFRLKWLEGDGKWGGLTTLALQRFLLSMDAERWPRLKLLHVPVDGIWGSETVLAFQEFLVHCDIDIRISGFWTTEDNAGLAIFLHRSGYYNRSHIGSRRLKEPDWPDRDFCLGFQAWLRDQGCPCGLKGASYDGVDGCIFDEDGKFDSTTTLSIQIFLNLWSKDFVRNVSQALAVDGEWDSRTIRCFQDFLMQQKTENPAEMTGSWDHATLRATQSFLAQQGYYFGTEDGDFSSVSVVALKTWLQDKGFPSDAMESPTWGNDTTKAIQTFLNSYNAQASREHASPKLSAEQRKVQEAACYSLALLGGVEDLDDAWIAKLESLKGFDTSRASSAAELGQKFKEAREALREKGILADTNWWGTLELIARLHNKGWLEAAGGEAALAAMQSLLALVQAEKAPSEMKDVVTAQLLQHLRRGGVVEVVCHVLGALLLNSSGALKSNPKNSRPDRQAVEGRSAVSQ